MKQIAENRVKVAAGEIEVIVEAINNYINNADVCEQGCCALLNMTENNGNNTVSLLFCFVWPTQSENKEITKKLNIASTLQKVKEEHSSLSVVVDDILDRIKPDESVAQDHEGCYDQDGYYQGYDDKDGFEDGVGDTFSGTPYKALYDFEAQQDGDLDFKEGDTIYVTKMEGDWWEGECNGAIGTFPNNYVAPV